MYDILKKFLLSGIFPSPPEQYHLGTPLSFYGFTDGHRPEETGAALVCVEGDELCAYGILRDFDLYNDVREDNDTTWLKGDVFELLFQIRGHEDYYEFHSTPEGYRLQLHIQDYRTFRSVPHEEKICDAGLGIQNSFEKENNFWFCELRIPFSGVNLTKDLIPGSAFTFARQNYTHGKEGPEITSSQIFPKTAHTPSMWHKIV